MPHAVSIVSTSGQCWSNGESAGGDFEQRLITRAVATSAKLIINSLQICFVVDILKQYSLFPRDSNYPHISEKSSNRIPSRSRQCGPETSLMPCPQCVNNPGISLRYNVFFVFTLCFVKTSAVGYWKRMMVMHGDVCNHWLGAGCREEIRTRVPSVSPCHTPCAFSNKISRQKEMFCQCQWYTISTEKEIQLFRRRADKDVRSDKSDNERTPLVNAVASISNIKYVNWRDSKYDKSTVIEAGV